MAESADNAKVREHLRLERELFSDALSSAGKTPKKVKPGKTKAPAKTSTPKSVSSDSAALSIRKRAALTATKAAQDSADRSLPAVASGEIPAKRFCGQKVPDKTTDAPRGPAVDSNAPVDATDGPRSPVLERERDVPIAAPPLNHHQMMDIARMVAEFVRAGTGPPPSATDTSVSSNPAYTVGGAPNEDGAYRPDLLPGSSFATYGDTAKRVDGRKTAQFESGNRDCPRSSGFSWETQTARASGSGLASRSGLPRGSTSRTLVDHVRGSPAHVTQDLPSVAYPRGKSTSVLRPSVANSTAPFPSGEFAPVITAPVAYAAGFWPPVENPSVMRPAVDYTATGGRHVRNTSANITSAKTTSAKNTSVRNTDQNFQRGFAPRPRDEPRSGRDDPWSGREGPRSGRDSPALLNLSLAEDGGFVVSSDSDQEVYTLSPPKLTRADQVATESFRLSLPAEEEEQEDSSRASEMDILRKSLSSVAALIPRLVRRVPTVVQAGFDEVATEEFLQFAPHPNVETWVNQHFNFLRNMRSLGGRPWTPEICPVAEWPQSAPALLPPKRSKLLLVDSLAAPPPSGPSATEAQAMLKPDKCSAFNKMAKQGTLKVEGHLQVALDALSATSSLASALSLALRDPDNAHRLSPTPDPDDILAIMDAFPVALSHLSRGLTGARVSATVSRRDEFLALTETPKALADKLRVVPMSKGSLFGSFLKTAQEVAPSRPPASAEEIGFAMASAMHAGHKQKQWGGSRSRQPQPKGRGKSRGQGRSGQQRGRGRGKSGRRNPPPPPPQGN